MNWFTAIQTGLQILPSLYQTISIIAEAVEADAPARSGQAKAEAVKELIDSAIHAADEIADPASASPEARELVRRMATPSTQAVVKFNNATGRFHHAQNGERTFI